MSLSSFIHHDLKRRIQNGEKLPTNLVLMDLARHYGVSITPVRHALRELIDAGFVRRLDNGQIEINQGKIGTGSSEEPMDLPKVPEDWDEILLTEVMLASLNLAAVYLRESNLAKKFKVGRSIIRTTFSRFAGAGLLDHVPHRGWRVRPYRAEEMEAYLAVREVMELMALDLALPNMKSSEIVGLLDHENDTLNNSLHRYIIEKSGNRYISDFFKQSVSRYYTKLFYYAAPETAVVDEMAAQHHRVLDALLQRDQETAREELAHHIRSQKVVLEKLLIGSPDTGANGGN